MPTALSLLVPQISSDDCVSKHCPQLSESYQHKCWKSHCYNASEIQGAVHFVVIKIIAIIIIRIYGIELKQTALNCLI